MSKTPDVLRIEALSDAIFAVAITLLIVGIELPHVPQDQLGVALLGMLPTFFNFILSFVLLALFWNIQRKQFRFIKETSDRIVWINLFLLFFVVLIPFSTVLIEKYGNLVSAIFFHTNLLIIGLLYLRHWRYAVKILC